MLRSVGFEVLVVCLFDTKVGVVAGTSVGVDGWYARASERHSEARASDRAKRERSTSEARASERAERERSTSERTSEARAKHERANGRSASKARARTSKPRTSKPRPSKPRPSRPRPIKRSPPLTSRGALCRYFSDHDMLEGFTCYQGDWVDAAGSEWTFNIHVVARKPLKNTNEEVEVG
jgi:hypothetical protein